MSKRMVPNRRAHGQGLVEFALVVPILLLILLSIFQFGWILAAQIGVSNAIREAARFAATNPTTTVAEAGTNKVATESQLTTILPRNVNFYAASSLSSATATYCEYDDPNSKKSVRVRIEVQYRHPLFVPVISSILDGIDGATDSALRVGATEEMRVENSPPLTGTTGLPSC